MKVDSKREMSPTTLRKIKRLREEFVDSFAQRVPKLNNWRTEALAENPDGSAVKALRTEIHQLRGSAGLYQMDELYQHLNTLQDQLDALLAEDPLRALPAEAKKHLDRIIKLLKYPGRFR